MAQYAILAQTIVMGILMGVTAFVAYRTGHRNAMEAIQFTLVHSESGGMKEPEPKYEMVQDYKPIVTPEILMAYGVDSARGLPKDVKQSLGFDPDKHDDVNIDDIIRD